MKKMTVLLAATFLLHAGAAFAQIKLPAILTRKSNTGTVTEAEAGQGS